MKRHIFLCTYVSLNKNTQIADRVYSLFNGYIFTNGTILKFKLLDDQQQQQQAEGPILEVRNLPSQVEDHNILYDIFRPYGPLSICKPITEDGAHRGKALLQYFYRCDSDNAIGDMVRTYEWSFRMAVLFY
jgi:hypothetical protein